jgi:hypothetical protein
MPVGLTGRIQGVRRCSHACVDRRYVAGEHGQLQLRNRSVVDSLVFEKLLGAAGIEVRNLSSSGLRTPSLDVVSDCEMDDGRSIVGVEDTVAGRPTSTSCDDPDVEAIPLQLIGEARHAMGRPTAVTHAADASRSVV